MGVNYEADASGNITGNSLITDTISEKTPAAGVTIDTVPIKDGLVDGVDISALKTDVDGFPDQLKTLTTNEITQVSNIDGSTISTTQWSYVGSMDQAVSTTSNITVNSLNTTGNITGGSYTTDIINEETPAAGVTIDTVLVKDGLVDGVDISALKTDVDGFPDELKTLTAGEIQQVANINTSTVSTVQWSYVGTMDQSVSTTSNLTVNSLITSGLVDGVDVSALKTDVDGFPDELKTLTTAEIQQVANIGTSFISATEWNYVSTLNQSLRTTSNVTFNTLDLTAVPNDNTESNLLVWNATTKDIEYRTVASLPFSGGDVSGPVSSTNNAIALWNGTGGDILEDTSVTITSGTDLSTPGTIAALETAKFGNPSAAAPGLIQCSSQTSAAAWLCADTNNSGETDHPEIYFTQDNAITTSIIGLTDDNDLRITTASSLPTKFEVYTGGAVTSGGSTSLPTVSNAGNHALTCNSDGSVDIGQSLSLPTAGGTATPLVYYEELDTTLTLGSALSGSIGVKLRRTNDMVTVMVDNVSKAIAASSSLITLSGMPTRFQRANTLEMSAYCRVTSGSAAEEGYIDMPSGVAGRIDVRRAAGGNFTSSAGFNGFTITYSVNGF